MRHVQRFGVLEPERHNAVGVRSVNLAPPPEIGQRKDFQVGQRVSFTDRDLQHRVGLIVRINQQTATIASDGQSWRVSYALLRPIVEA